MKANNPSISTVKKVLKHLQSNDRFTPTQIGTDLKLNHNAVLASLDFLEELNQIVRISNGNTSFISLKEVFRQGDVDG